jgi:hypothetical protein
MGKLTPGIFGPKLISIIETHLMALDSNDVAMHVLSLKLTFFAVRKSCSDDHCSVAALSLFVISVLHDTLLHSCADDYLQILFIFTTCLS